MVRTYAGKMVLSIPRENLNIAVNDEIGVVEDACEDERERKMSEAVIVGVKFFDVYKGCYACKGKVTSISNLLGVCSRCGTSQRLDRCKDVTTAKIDVEADGELRSLGAFSPILDEICGGIVSKETLLTCEPFSLM